MSVGADRLSRIEEKLDQLADDGIRTRVAVAELAATLRTHTERQTERTAARDMRCTDHEGRLRVIERTGADEHGGQIAALETEIRKLREWRARLAGIAAAIGAGVGTPLGAAAVLIARAIAPAS